MFAKGFFQSKTCWLAVIQAVTGGLVIFFTQADMVGYVAIIKSFGDIALRYATTAPMVDGIGA